MTRRPSAAEVKSHALDRLENILDRLAPGGRISGGLYSPRNPTRDDKKPGSFVIRVTGAARGSFVEYVNPDSEKGDVIDLVSYLLTGGALDFKSRERRGAAIRWIADFCGLERMQDSQRAAAHEAAKRRQEQAAGEAQRVVQKRTRAFNMWLKAGGILGSPAEKYLANRGIPIAGMAERLETDLRCIPSLEYWLDRKRHEHSNKPYGERFPCMIAALRDIRDVVRAVHCTFLSADGQHKADVVKPKLIWPDYKGCVIHLAKGGSGLTVKDAIAAGLRETVAVSEGIEDGLTLALGAPELRVWAAASLANIGNAPALPIVDSWLIHRQNDNSYAAVKAFDQVRRKLEETGRPVAEIASHEGKDINDLLRA